MHGPKMYPRRSVLTETRACQRAAADNESRRKAAL